MKRGVPPEVLPLLSKKGRQIVHTQISGFDHFILSAAVIFFLVVSSAAGSPSLQQEFVNQSKDQQRQTCGGMSDAVASSVAPSTLVGTPFMENFTAHNAIDGTLRTYFKSKEMIEGSGSRVEWIRVHFSRLQREGGPGKEVCGKYLRAVRLRNDKTVWCNSTNQQFCLWVS